MLKGLSDEIVGSGACGNFSIDTLDSNVFKYTIGNCLCRSKHLGSSLIVYFYSNIGTLLES